MDKTMRVIYPESSEYDGWEERENRDRLERIEAALIKAGIMEKPPKRKSRTMNVADLSKTLKEHYAASLEKFFK